MIGETRTFKLTPNMRARFVEIFCSKSVPKHAKLVMKILGPFLSVEDADTFFFMRSFPDLPSREPMKARYYEGDLWKHELGNLLMPIIERYELVVVDDRGESDSLVRGNCNFFREPLPGPRSPAHPYPR